jgi:hypothetical protein
MGKAAVCLLLAVLIAGPALAGPLTYNFTSGQLTVTATSDPGGVIILNSTLLPLDGVFVEFDAGTIDLTDLLLTIPSSGNITLDTPYGGYDQFVIESASISPGVGYATLLGQDNGGGNYSFLAGPLDTDGVYSATDSTLVNPPITNVPVPFTDTSLISGSINIDTGILTLTGITLAELPGALFGETDDMSIKADIVFVGLVPEPSTAVLFGLGLVGLASSRRRNFLK